MERTFSRLVKDKTVTVQGSHWAALINAYGCVGRDLDKATAVFNSIEEHESTKASGLQLPDAVTFEALINVLVTLRRTDLVPEYLDRLQRSGVHMTAYIANLLIRGYAAVGDIEQARSMFESLADPPVGVAAPNNHAPHDVAAPLRISPNELVYREVRSVSTRPKPMLITLVSRLHGRLWFARNWATAIVIMRSPSSIVCMNGMCVPP